MSGHQADQVEAAERDAALALQGAAEAAGAGVVSVTDAVWLAKQVARAVEGLPRCLHLRRGGPQPVIARLPVGRVDCQRCARTVRRPAPGSGRRCDWCGTSSMVAEGQPRMVQLGPWLVFGDACPECAAAFDVNVAVAEQ